MKWWDELDYERKTAVKITLVISLVFLVILGLILRPLLHREDVFEVTSPRGSPLLASNFTFEGVHYTNAVVFNPSANQLIIHSTSMEPSNITITVTTPGWCVDYWEWGGINRGWILKGRCVRKLSLSYYDFTQRPARESGEAYWYLGDGIILIFHKNGGVKNYENVSFTLEYLGMKSEGSFIVSLGGKGR